MKSINRKVDQKITCKGDQKNPGVLLWKFYIKYPLLKNIFKIK